MQMKHWLGWKINFSEEPSPLNNSVIKILAYQTGTTQKGFLLNHYIFPPQSLELECLSLLIYVYRVLIIFLLGIWILFASLQAKGNIFVLISIL